MTTCTCCSCSCCSCCGKLFLVVLVVVVLVLVVLVVLVVVLVLVVVVVVVKGWIVPTSFSSSCIHRNKRMGVYYIYKFLPPFKIKTRQPPHVLLLWSWWWSSSSSSAIVRVGVCGHWCLSLLLFVCVSVSVCVCVLFREKLGFTPPKLTYFHTTNQFLYLYTPLYYISTPSMYTVLYCRVG